jgi:hypothetical protein
MKGAGHKMMHDSPIEFLTRQHARLLECTTNMDIPRLFALSY